MLAVGELELALYIGFGCVPLLGMVESTTHYQGVIGAPPSMASTMPSSSFFSGVCFRK